MRLSVENLAFGYPGRLIGQHANFVIDAGAVLCLLGPNGSGKTTLFRTLLGLLPAKNGAVRLDGEDIAGWSRAAIARVMGYVPQAHAAYFPFTVIETVLMGRTARMRMFATPSHTDVEIAERMLELLRIAHLRDAIYTRISGGERQLTLIARALAQEPRILVMDEPTASLDFGNQMLVLSHIRALSQHGIGVVLSTHDPDHAFFCADRVVLLKDGNLVRVGTPEEVITADSLHELYGVEVEVMERTAHDGYGRVRVCVPLRADASGAGG